MADAYVNRFDRVTAFVTPCRGRRQSRFHCRAVASLISLGCLFSSVVSGQPGSTLFFDNLNGNLNDFTIVASGGDARITGDTASQGRSLRLGEGLVRVHTDPIVATVPSAQLSVWVRRGSDSFSENPDNQEDLEIEYRDSGGNWVLIDSMPGSGTPGEIITPVYDLPAGALHAQLSIRFTQTAGSGSGWDYWHIDDVRVTQTASATLLYSFEESTWTGAGGEVEASAGSGPGGTVFGGATTDNGAPALPSNPGSCRYGQFDGIDDYIEFPDGPAFDLDEALTVSAWINMRSYPGELHTIASKDWNYEFHINSSGQVYWWWNESNGTVRTLTSSTRIALNRWYHIAITYERGRQVVYVDGTPVASSNRNASLRLNDSPLFIGTDLNIISRAFHGSIDEVLIDSRAYTQTEIVELRDATHPCAAAAAQFSINHDTVGIHCLPEEITVNVIDSIAGTPLTNYNARIQLDTQSGFGTWSRVSGSGAFSDPTGDDGVAFYDWPLGESQARFQLFYPQGASAIDIDAWQTSDPGIRDTDAEGVLTFVPNGFTVTAVPINPPDSFSPFDDAQTAAIPFPVYIAAYGQTPDDPTCGVIEGYAGPRNLKFWSDYLNPSSGFRAIEVDGVAVSGSEASAGNQPVTFVNGQASVMLKYKDAGQIRLSMKDDTTAPTALPTGIRGATAAFVSRPANFELSAIADAAGGVLNQAPNSPTGPVLVAAGREFQVTVTALDAEGDPTRNFGREMPAATVELDASIVAPGSGRMPGVVAATGFGAFADGSATGTDFTWSEVGIIELLPTVSGGDYLGSGDVIGTSSGNVGRFVPDHFDVVTNAPNFLAGCSAGSMPFTYLGQPFGYGLAPMIRATAMSASGSRTENYSGAWFRLDESTPDNRVYATSSGTLDPDLLNALPNLAAELDVSEFAPGVATIRFDANSMTALGFERTTPVAPFGAEITLSVDILDADNVAASNPVVFDGTGSGIVFDGGPQMRFGRLRIFNAIGSERVDLPVPLRAEYFVDAVTGFSLNTDDLCSTDVSLTFSTYTENLTAGDTCVLDAGFPGNSGVGCVAAAPPSLQFAEPPVDGDFRLRLAAPGEGNGGSVVIETDVPAWLRFDWDSAVPGEENPSGIATFGLYDGEGSHIYMRELY